VKLLEGIKIIDFSHRLPGPLAGKLLADLGAKIIKVEDEKFKDPFLVGLFAQMDESFPAWYEELNKNKQVIRLDFKSDKAFQEVSKLLRETDAIIMGPPDKVRENLKITYNDLNSLENNFAVVELLASKSHVKNMHDLNSLAETGFLALHLEGRNEDIVDPPFLPISGVTFGLKVALDLVAAILKSKKENTKIFHSSYLMESTEEIIRPFWPNKIKDMGMKKFLHNGRYPCYSIYKTKDNKYVALAAVEEKFWNRFCELFSINISPKERFSTDPLNFKKISQKFLSFSQEEIMIKVENEDICLSKI
jgi:alpha-methylacyl-CoA racemase